MTELSPKLPRKAFGYDPSVVDQMLADRDSMLALAERRVREAEGKAARLEEQLRAREVVIADLNEKAAAAPPEAEAPSEPEEEPLTPRFMSEELAKIIMAAEESTSQILAKTRLSTRDQILEADRLWREVQGEVVRFANWREQAETALSSVQSAIDHARAQIESVPDRVQNALAPAVEAMVRVDSQMAGFSAASTLPLLATPTGIGEARARMEHDGETFEPSVAEPAAAEPFATEHAAPEADVDEDAPGDHIPTPPESDWPSLGEPPSLNKGDAPPMGDDALMEEAHQELRQFQAPRDDIESSVEDGSAVWGA